MLFLLMEPYQKSISKNLQNTIFMLRIYVKSIKIYQFKIKKKRIRFNYFKTQRGSPQPYLTLQTQKYRWKRHFMWYYRPGPKKQG